MNQTIIQTSLLRMGVVFLLAVASLGRPGHGSSSSTVPTILDLGTHPSANPFSTNAAAVSDDGTTVVGHFMQGTGPVPFRWRKTSGFEVLHTSGVAQAVNSDGSTVSGTTYDSAFRWSEAAGLQFALVGHANLSAPSISYDGGTVIGQAQILPWFSWVIYRWTGSDVSQVQSPTTFLSPTSGLNHALSADGNIMIGHIQGHGAYRWTPSTGTAIVGDFTPYDLSADGQTAAGSRLIPHGNSNQPRAVRWTLADGLHDLTVHEPSVAYAISGDGNTIVGQDHEFRAAIWRENIGMVNLRTYLESRGANLNGWTLIEARGVNHDGTIIVGNGFFSEFGDGFTGNQVAWIVDLGSAAELEPEPQVCDVWLSQPPGITAGPTTIHRVRAMAEFDGQLVVAGGFTSIGGVNANRIARWSGSNWQPFGSGLNAQVNSLFVHDGNLIAGGNFTVAYGGGIARWTGTFWQAIGGQFNTVVNAMENYDGEIIAAGAFTTIAGVPFGRIARWDGTQWHPLGAGANSTINALAVYNGDLIAAGNFTSVDGVSGTSRVARWNGDSWAPLGSGLNNTVYALTVFDDGTGPALYAAGEFTQAIGGPPALRVAKWNGSAWSAVGAGFPQPGRSFAIYEGSLVAAISSLTEASTGAKRVVRWNGLEWQPLGPDFDEQIHALIVHGGALHAGGAFGSNLDATRGIASWTNCELLQPPNEAPYCEVDLAEARLMFAEPSPGSFVVTAGQTITVTFHADDLDGDHLTATLSGAPAGATLSATSGDAPFETVFSWTPTEADAAGAPYGITVSFDDDASGGGGETSCSFSIEAINLAPIAVCSAYTSDGDPSDGVSDITVECDSPAGRIVTLDGSGSFDPDGDSALLTYRWEVSDIDVILDNPDSPIASGLFPPGITMATFTVTDQYGAFSTCDILVRVQDNTPPKVMVTSNLAALWPPNHKVVPVQIIVTATDECYGPGFMFPLTVTLRSNEPDNAPGNGDGNTTGDCHGEDGYTSSVDITSAFTWDAESESWVATIQLRAERASSGKGRAYTIDATALDCSGNLGTSSCVIVVPRSQGQGGN